MDNGKKNDYRSVRETPINMTFMSNDSSATDGTNTNHPEIANSTRCRVFAFPNRNRLASHRIFCHIDMRQRLNMKFQLNRIFLFIPAS